MDELLIALGGLAVVVVAIAAVGHGLWVVGRAILRAVFRIDATESAPTARCMRCGDPRGLKRGVCSTCGYESVAVRRRALRSVIRELEQVRGQQRFESTTCDRAIDVLRALDEQLHAGAGAAAAPGATRDATAARQTEPAPSTRPSAAVPTSAVARDGARLEIVEAELVIDDVSSAAAQPVAAATQSPAASQPAASATPFADPLSFARDPEPAPKTFSPRRTLADMMQSFMEEKNIRWGELASGMLIVGSAIGLVISLRATLAEISEKIRYFPALMFLLGTAAIHGAGLYTLKRWKLRATSRGVLIIATLLVPLSFVAGILLSGRENDPLPVISPLYLAAVLVGLLSYGSITYLSARSLFVEGWWRILMAVMGTSAGQLVINRLADAGPGQPSLTRTSSVLALALASFLGATIAQLQQVARKPRLTRARSAQTFTVLGIAAFSLAVACGLLVFRMGAARETLTLLTPSLSLVAAVVLALGITIHRRSEAPQAAETRTVGTALAVFGALAMAGAIVFAWPAANVLIAVSLVTAVALVALAIVGKTPILHAGAATAATFACWLIFLRLSIDPAADSSALIRALLMGRSAIALLIAAVGIGGIGGWLLRMRRPAVAGPYLGTAAGIAVVSGLIGLYAGFWSGVDGDWMTPLYAVHGVLGLSAAWLARNRRPPVTDQGLGWLPAAGAAWFGSVLSLIALIHLLGWNRWFGDQLVAREWTIPDPNLLALVSHALLTELLGWVAWLSRPGAGQAEDADRARNPGADSLVGPLTWSGVLSAAVAVPSVLHVTPHMLGVHAAYVAVIAVALSIAGIVHRTPRLISAAYVATSVAIGFVVAAWAAEQNWAEFPLRDLRHVQAQLTALGLWCGAWTISGWLTHGQPVVRRLLGEIVSILNPLLLDALIIVLLGLGIIGCYPGVLVEMGVVRPDHAIALDQWHVQAPATGSWIALASLALALGVACLQRMRQVTWIAIIGLTAVVPLLVSGAWEPAHGVASSLRWTYTGYALCWTVVVVLRRQLSAGLRRLTGWNASHAERLSGPVRDTAMAVGMLPVIGLTALGVGQAAAGIPWGGPLVDTWFGQLTPAISYSAPLIGLVVVMLALAVGERMASYAALGSVLCECAIAVAVGLHVIALGTGWTESWSIVMGQALAIGLGAYGLVWRLLSRWIEPDTVPSERALLRLQVALSAIAVSSLSLCALVPLLAHPDGLGGELADFGSWPNYVALVLAAVGVAWYVRHDRRSIAVLCVALPVALGPFAASTAHTLISTAPWVGYHALTAYWLVLGLAAACAVWWLRVGEGRTAWLPVLRASSVVLGAAVMALALRGWSPDLRHPAPDPWHPAWTAGVFGGLFLLWAAAGIGNRAQAGAYLSAACGLMGVWPLWSYLARQNGYELETGGVYVLVLAGAAVASFWLLVDVWYQSRRNESLDQRRHALPVHRFLADTLSALMGLVVVGTTVPDIGRPGLGVGLANLTLTEALAFGAFAGLGVLVFAIVWDRTSKAALRLIYVWGVIGIVLGLHLLELTTDEGAGLTVMAACLAGAGYIALTGHLWRYGANLAQWATRLHIPDPVVRLEHASTWLPGTNVLGTLLICGLGFVTIAVANERGERMGTALAPVLLAYGVGCLAQQQRRYAMQCFALLILSLSAVYIGWADVDASAAPAAGTLMYAARLLISVAAMTLLYTVVAARWLSPQTSWHRAVRSTSLILAAVTIATLVVVLVQEVRQFQPSDGAPLNAPEVIAISVMLAGFVVALLAMALLRGRDPLNLTEKGKMGYVYTAQFVSAVLFAHIYLAEPQLFEMGLKEYWPYLVMLLAFGSVAFGELCIRRKWRVIAEPMLRTGGFLPLVPAVAAWAFSDVRYPLVLFCGGLVYVFLAITRRSVYAAAAAAVMGNSALWALLHEQGMAILLQPQLWLIPPALSVLVAAHVNRARLSNESLTAIRYICVMIIYISSAGEMFMKLMGGPEEWLRPIILASLSVAGIFAGILLRVRAFLYLGASFLLLSIIAMVWNASQLVQHTWPWWLFGITAGLAILALFGIFEKQRHEVKSLIARLRQWEA